MKYIVTYLILLIIILCTYLIYAQKTIEAFSPSSWSTDTDLVIVSSHWEEQLDWLSNIETPVIVCGKEGEKHAAIESSPTCKTSNSGREASSYLKYIVAHYDNLPRYIAFIHGHETAWHQKHDILKRLTENKWKEVGYFTLNGHVVDNWNSSHELWPALQKIWPSYFKDALSIDCPTYMTSDCCAQFVVSRDRILKHPRSTYEKWLQLSLSDYKNFNIQDREMAILFEWTWHMIFGEPAVRV